jgi:hypothetical protein
VTRLRGAAVGTAGTAVDPEIAGITERALGRIVAELVEDGYISVEHALAAQHREVGGGHTRTICSRDARRKRAPTTEVSKAASGRSG